MQVELVTLHMYTCKEVSLSSVIVWGGRNNECILVLHGHIPLFFHAFLILTYKIISIFSEWQGGRWKVTKVKKPKPGRSAEKLRKQMEKLQLDYNQTSDSIKTVGVTKVHNSDIQSYVGTCLYTEQDLFECFMFASIIYICCVILAII